MNSDFDLKPLSLAANSITSFCSLGNLTSNRVCVNVAELLIVTIFTNVRIISVQNIIITYPPLYLYSPLISIKKPKTWPKLGIPTPNKKGL
jgi:hypothetical protein